MPILHAIGWVLGVYPYPAGTPITYQFWSGLCPSLVVVAAIVGFYVKHNCHRKGCPRIAKHTVDGTPWCSRHHKEARCEIEERSVSL